MRQVSSVKAGSRVSRPPSALSVKCQVDVSSGRVKAAKCDEYQVSRPGAEGQEEEKETVKEKKKKQRL